MATNAKVGLGTQLKRGDGGSPETFSKIAEVKTLKGPTESANAIDATNLDSAGGYEETIPGLKSAGAVQAEMNFVPQDPTYKAALSDFQTGRRGNWQIVFSDSANTTASFQAWVSKLDRSADPKSAMSVTLELQITGQVTWAP